ncbi:MAG: hypothetical protein ACI9XP_000297 [Lentimonas sp.]|jgi:hypothetical protein
MREKLMMYLVGYYKAKTRINNMNNNLKFLAVFFVATCAISWKSMDFNLGIEKYDKAAFSGGAQPGKTGAPGEANCTQCHGGTVIASTTENQLVLSQNGNPVTEYLPGEVYDVTLDFTATFSNRGFQSTALNSSNQKAGEFASANGVGISNGGGKQYANHTTGSTGTTTPWTWQWTAPAQGAGEVTFYVATNAANANGQSSGDQIYISNHKFNSTAGIAEVNKSVSDFNASFSAQSQKVIITFSSAISGTNHLNVLDLNGRSVINQDLGTAKIGDNKHSILLPDHLKNGMYFVHFFVNNNPMTKSIMVQR